MSRTRSTERKEKRGATKRPTGAPQGLLQELGSGRPLDAETRARLEPHLGQNLEQVRVHTGDQAEEAARAIEARAFTLGRDVVFGAGQYKPGTTEGLALLAHEATHVAQQAATGVPALQRAPSDQPPKFESPKTKKGTNFDVVKAFLALPEVQAAIERFKKQFSEAPIADKAGAVAGTAAVGAGAIAGIAANPEARKEALDALHGTEIPVPGLTGFKLQIFTQETQPKFDPLKPLPKPEPSTPTGMGAMIKFEKRF